MRGKWWAVFGRLLVSVILLFLVGTVIFLILVLAGLMIPDSVWPIYLPFIAVALFGAAFAVVWFVANLDLLYRSLYKRKPLDTFKLDSYKTLRVIYIVLIIICGLLYVTPHFFGLITNDRSIDVETQIMLNQMEARMMRDSVFNLSQFSDNVFNLFDPDPFSPLDISTDVSDSWEKEIADFYDLEESSDGLADTEDTNPFAEDFFPIESPEGLPSSEPSDGSSDEPPADF